MPNVYEGTPNDAFRRQIIGIVTVMTKITMQLLISLWELGSLTLSSPESVMETLEVVLAFESADEITHMKPL